MTNPRTDPVLDEARLAAIQAAADRAFSAHYENGLTQADRYAANRASAAFHEAAEKLEAVDPLSVIGYTSVDFLPWSAALLRGLGEKENA